jgi:hypothetical protein
MFRVLALLQGVDLQQIAETQRNSDDEVPPEEPSMQAVLGQQQMLDRNFEVKLLALQRGRQEYDHRLSQLREKSERYDRLARDWEQRLRQQDETTTQENMAKVISDLEQVKPATAKNLMMRWIEEGKMNDVITMLGKMSENKKKKILQSFATQEELDKLHEIHRLMLDKSVNKVELNKALDELSSLEQ